MRLEKISASATVGAGFIGEVTSFFRTISDDFLIGIQLKYTYSGAGGDLVEINIPSLGVSWNDTTYGDLEARLYGDVHAEDDTWHVSNAVFRGYRAGTLVVTASAGNLRSSLIQKVPSSIPLIGIPPLVQAYGFLPAIAAPPAGLTTVSSSIGYPVDLATFSYSGSASIQESYSFSGSIRGGWRWDVNGTKEQFPTKLQLITPPTISCSVSAPPLPNVTSSDIWTNTADAFGTAVINGAATDSTIQASWVQPVPDLSRRFRRLGDDYSALCVRYSLPSARRHGVARCNTNRNDTYEEVIPARAQYLGIVGIADDPYEDALKDRPECLYSRLAHHAVSPDGFNGVVHEKISELIGNDAPPTGYIPALNAPNKPITGYWDFLCNPHWSHKLWFEDWDVDGTEGLTLDNYWCPIRSQWQYHPALPGHPRLQTRNHVLLDSIDSCSGWHELYIGHGPRNLGLSRWRTVDIPVWTSHTYSSSSSALFATTGASAVFGASVQLTNSSTSVVLDLDIGHYLVPPYQCVHSADQLVLNWSATNVSSILYSLVGWDGTEVPVASAVGTYTVPRGPANVYAGSWAIDNGVGLIIDTGSDSTSGIVASGVSHAIMADTETVHSFNLGPTSTYQTLRARITTTAATGQVVSINYPTFNRVGAFDPSLVWESGQARSLLYKNQAGVRYGNTRWWDDFNLRMFIVPYVTGVGTVDSAVDQLATARVWLAGSSGASGQILTALRAQFNSVEGSSMIHFAQNTAAPWLPNPSSSRVQLALTNDWAECPPLCLAPRKARDTDWQETGGFVLDVWSWILGNHRFVRPGYNTGQTQDTAVWDLWDNSGNKYTTVEAGYVEGWNVSKAAPVVNNNETNWQLKVGSPRYARVRPFRGFFGYTASGTVIENNCWQHQQEDGTIHQTSVKSGQVVYRRADSTVPLPGWTVETQLTDVSGVTHPRSAVDVETGRIWMSYMTGGQIYRRYSDDGGSTFSSPVLVV